MWIPCSLRANFSFITASAILHKLTGLLHYKFSLKYFIIPVVISLTHGLFISTLLNAQIFWHFPVFFLLLISSLILLRLKNMLRRTAVLCGLLRLHYGSASLQKNANSEFVGYYVLEVLGHMCSLLFSLESTDLVERVLLVLSVIAKVLTVSPCSL